MFSPRTLLLSVSEAIKILIKKERKIIEENKKEMTMKRTKQKIEERMEE
jgi:hypothetical protein